MPRKRSTMNINDRDVRKNNFWAYLLFMVIEICQKILIPLAILAILFLCYLEVVAIFGEIVTTVVAGILIFVVTMYWYWRDRKMKDLPV